MSPLRFLVIPALVVTATFARAAGVDTQLWSDLKATAQWTDRLDLFAAGALRFDENVSHHTRTSYQGGLNFRATPVLTLTPSYQYITHDPADEIQTFEHRFSLVTALRLPVERFETSLSAGVEYRLRRDQSDGWRVRPKLKIKHALGPEAWALAGYVAEEAFYDPRAAGWTRNRLFAGLEKKVGPHWVLDLYYCRQQDLSRGGLDLNIIGVSMRVSADKSAVEDRFDLGDG